MRTGASYLVYGEAAGFRDNPNQSVGLTGLLNLSEGFRIIGEAVGDDSGTSVHGAGDVNGDGFADLIIGAPNADPNGNASGASYVVFGKSGKADAHLELADLNGANGFKISGGEADAASGNSVSAAGDVNGDGFADLIVGAYRSDANGTDTGAAYVVFGRASGFAANINLNSLNGTNGFQIKGEGIANRAGFSVSGAGDLNGDGVDDLVVGAPYASTSSGRSYVVFGIQADLTLTGDGNGNTLTGKSGNDTLSGLGGMDTLSGKGGNDLLDGGSAGDSMTGGTGDDTYVVDSASDQVIELAGQGTDTIRSSLNGLVLASNVENLVLIDGTLNGTGNGLDNTLTGNGLGNTLRGEGGNDTLDGEGGNDRLEGGAGADSMAGGTGDDTYVVLEAGDQVSEGADDGSDTVEASINYTLGAHLEALLLAGSALRGTGNGNGLGNDLTGNVKSNTLSGLEGDDVLVGLGGNDSLDGGTGADRLQGGVGNDAYAVDNAGDLVQELAGEGRDGVTASVSVALSDNVETLVLIGAALSGTGNILSNTITGNTHNNVLSGLGGQDRLEGGDGNDLLDGGLGTDTLIGGLGNDRYVVDYAGDRVTEVADAGHDTVSTDLRSYTLGANVEDLILLTGALTGTGNEIANALAGNAAKNTLKGLDGDDRLDGGAGADRLEGGAGNDTYLVDDALDQVIETGAGLDVVLTSVTYQLGTGQLVETLQANAGNAGLMLTGNERANTILGGGGGDGLAGGGGIDTLDGGRGNDRIEGGAGRDTLTGGTGADTFVLTPSAADRDHLADFDSGPDALEISASLFGGGLAGGVTLTAEQFVVNGNGQAAETDDRFIYNKGAGELWFDADGSGNAFARQLVATFDANTALLRTDFDIV